MRSGDSFDDVTYTGTAHSISRAPPAPPLLGSLSTFRDFRINMVSQVWFTRLAACGSIKINALLGIKQAPKASPKAPKASSARTTTPRAWSSRVENIGCIAVSFGFRTSANVALCAAASEKPATLFCGRGCGASSWCFQANESGLLALRGWRFQDRIYPAGAPCGWGAPCGAAPSRGWARESCCGRPHQTETTTALPLHPSHS